MPDAFNILRRLSPEKLDAVMGASPKRYREELFRRAGLKAKGTAFSLRRSQTEGRARKLYERLQAGFEVGEEVCAEVVRHYLYERRALLGAALDHLNVPHQEGLTNHDVGFMSSLEPEQVKALEQALAEFDEEDVEIYLRFMDVPVVR
ncbi:MAG: hypothetical protein ACFB9M_05940 [Myxococcota bacterium]